MQRLFGNGLLLVIALSVSGWGNLYAAAMCPHMGFQATANKATQRTPSNVRKAARHCHSEGTPTALNGTVRPKPIERGPAQNFNLIPALTSPQECGHCFLNSESGSKAAISSEGLTAKPDPSGQVLAATVSGLYDSLRAFTPQLRSGSPPGKLSRSHILLNVFRI